MADVIEKMAQQANKSEFNIENAPKMELHEDPNAPKTDQQTAPVEVLPPESGQETKGKTGRKKSTKTPAKDESKKEVTEVKPDDELVEAAVVFINERANQAVYKAYEEIGKYLLKNFFGNDIEQATSRNPRKPVSYRALCERPDLALRPDQFSVMIRVSAQEKFFELKNVDASTLSYTHKAELVKLPTTKPEHETFKVELVSRIANEGLSTRKIQEIISKHLEEGKPPLSPQSPIKLIEEVKELVKEDNLVKYDFTKERLKRLQAKKQDKLRSDAEGAKAELTKFVEKCNSLIGLLDELKTEATAAKKAKKKSKIEDAEANKTQEEAK